MTHLNAMPVMAKLTGRTMARRQSAKKSMRKSRTSTTRAWRRWMMPGMTRLPTATRRASAGSGREVRYPHRSMTCPKSKIAEPAGPVVLLVLTAAACGTARNGPSVPVVPITPEYIACVEDAQRGQHEDKAQCMGADDVFGCEGNAELTYKRRLMWCSQDAYRRARRSAGTD